MEGSFLCTILTFMWWLRGHSSVHPITRIRAKIFLILFKRAINVVQIRAGHAVSFGYERMHFGYSHLRLYFLKTNWFLWGSQIYTNISTYMRKYFPNCVFGPYIDRRTKYIQFFPTFGYLHKTSTLWVFFSLAYGEIQSHICT